MAELRIDAQRTVEGIVEAARVMLAEDPTVSTAEIAERAQVHRTTLTRYFPTREALVERLVERSMEAIEVRIAEAVTDDLEVFDAVRRTTLAWIGEARNWRPGRYAPLATVPTTGAAPAKIRARMVAVIERGQREGVIRTDIEVDTLFYAWGGLITTFNGLREFTSPENLAEDVVKLLRLP